MIELRRARPLLGTRVEVAVSRSNGATDEGRTEALAAIRAAFDEIATVHRLMSFQDPESELSRLNREAARGARPVDLRTFQLLRRAKALARATGGAFDPTIAPLLVEAGLLPRPAGAPEPDPHATIDDVELDGFDFHRSGRVRFRRPLWLDLGGIAKGFAVDRAVACLRRAGARSGWVDAGGDLRVFGARGLRVALRDPMRVDRVAAVIELKNAALASSSPAATLSADGERSHLVDPSTRAFLVGARGATVIAPSCTVAEAWTKAVLFAPDLAARTLPRRGARALLLDPCGVRWLDESDQGRAA